MFFWKVPKFKRRDSVLRSLRAHRCDPAQPRPHFAHVGSRDEYYGEEGGIYQGSALWERYSTTVLGCTGSPQPSSESAALERE